ncbi:MAG: helix-turn-helix domain-containing protein [Candidatus Latescibacteria bacterium]|nr:helix-turn-helix domain-containing protein [Candidatus Latescibacterota bacterium]
MINKYFSNKGDESSTAWFKLPDQSVATRREFAQPARKLHKHDFIELVIVLNGTGTHITEDTHHTIGPGDTFVILPQIEHGYTRTESLGLLNILIHNQHMQALEREFIGMPGFYALFKLEPRMRSSHQFKSQLRLSDKALVELSGWLNGLEAESSQSSHIACSNARAFLQLIVGNLCLHYEAIASGDSTKLLRFATCLRFMVDNLDRPLHLADLARQAGMSERSLSRNFQTTVGQSPMEYLLNMRLQRARELLLSSKSPIAQIGYDVGFSDGNYFTRQFRRQNGVSPREFRRHHQT